MVIRPATMHDARLLHRWRNDPLTRATSIDGAEVAWETHLAWLEASLSNPARTILIAESGGVAVGTVRIDAGAETELSWTVAPEQRGQGHGTRMLAMAAPAGPLIARIKRDNPASQHIAAAAGFTLRDDGAVQTWARC